MDRNVNTFNNALFKTMRKAAYTQKEIAEKLEVEINTIVNWEQGKFTPSNLNIEKIKKLFHVNKNFFILTTNESDVAQDDHQKKNLQKQHKEIWIFSFLLDIASLEVHLPAVDKLSKEEYAIIQKEILNLKKSLLDACN